MIKSTFKFRISPASLTGLHWWPNDKSKILYVLTQFERRYNLILWKLIPITLQFSTSNPCLVFDSFSISLTIAVIILLADHVKFPLDIYIYLFLKTEWEIFCNLATTLTIVPLCYTHNKGQHILLAFCQHHNIALVLKLGNRAAPGAFS